jgi:hypothetical protein
MGDASNALSSCVASKGKAGKIFVWTGFYISLLYRFYTAHLKIENIPGENVLLGSAIIVVAIIFYFWKANHVIKQYNDSHFITANTQKRANKNPAALHR